MNGIRQTLTKTATLCKKKAYLSYQLLISLCIFIWLQRRFKRCCVAPHDHVYNGGFQQAAQIC